MRQALQNPKVAVPLIVVVLGLAVAIALMPEHDPTHVPHLHFYYDLNTGKQFVVDSDEAIPPIDTESGKAAGVQVIYFSCGACNEKLRFVGFLSKFDEEQRKKVLAGQVGERSIRLLDDKDGEWVRQDSEAGQKLYFETLGKCPKGTRIRNCTPEAPE